MQTENHSGKLTIITVCYNAKQPLEETLESIKHQTDQDFEYIVIDGQSNDGTIELIKRNQAAIDRSLSEPDKGIYDAMNKGLNLATGQFTLFINAGDTLYKTDTIKHIKTLITDEDDVVLFPCISKNGKLLDSYYGDFPKLTWESYGCHQGYVVRTELYSARQFNECYKIKADRELLLRLYDSGAHFRYEDSAPICIYDTDGVSNNNLLKKELENFLISINTPGGATFKSFVLFFTKTLVFSAFRVLGIDWKSAKSKFFKLYR